MVEGDHRFRKAPNPHPRKKARREMEIDIQILILNGTLSDMDLHGNLLKARKKKENYKPNRPVSQ